MSGEASSAERRPQGARAAAELAALVRDSVSANAAREVLHLRFAALAPALRRPHHERLLRAALEPLLAAGRTRVFDLPNGDVVAVAPPPALGLETVRVALLRALESADGDIVCALRLPEEAAQLLAATAESLGLAPLPEVRAAPLPAGPPLATADLVAAEQAIAQADLDAMTVAQAVCHLDPEGAPAERLWDDRRVCWASLAAAVLPGVAIAAAPALRRRLARVAELRLLAGLARPARGWRPVGLALSPESVLGPGFARFDAALPAGRRQDVLIGFAAADVLAAPAAFLAARDHARGRGFRLALDDAGPALLALLPPARLGLDVLRLRWGEGLPAAGPAALAALLEGAAAPPEVVLAGVDRPAAIAWGWEAGIRLFQGPLVDRRRD
jgi:hypothetical protein